MPVTKQPLQWMSKPSKISGVPAGLEYLASLNSVHLKQKIDALEMFTGWQVKNKFRITDPSSGHVIGMFKEESDTCQRQCCKNMRAFTADVVDAQGDVVFKLDRPLHCNCFCCPDACDGGCGQEISILDSAGNTLGIARQNRDCSPCFCCLDWMLTIRDTAGNPKWVIGNNICKAACVCFDDVYVYIYDPQGNKVGTITKQWRGCLTECCTPADSILIEFPAGMTPGDKACILGTVLLTDYNLWEKNNE